MVKYTGRGLVVKRPGVLSKVQMLTLVLGVGVFSLLPTNSRGMCVLESSRFWLHLGEKKTDKEKSHKGIWWSECPGSIPGINSGRPRDTRDVWADLCGNSNSRGRMSAGQTGHMTGQMEHFHGTDGTHTRGCPAKVLYVYWFFSFPIHQLPRNFRASRNGNSDLCVFFV